MAHRPVCCIIRDGWGRGKGDAGDGIASANTPFTTACEKKWPTILLDCSGYAVGLPAGYQGNSEVGHLTIGSGRIIYQSLARVDKAIETGELAKNPVLVEALSMARTRKSTVHLMGLIQEEGVHAVTRHCHAFLAICKRSGVADVLVHGLSDGRDTPPRSAHEHFAFLQKGIDAAGVGRVASVIGRYYAMDRDKRWDRTELAYQALRLGRGAKAASWKAAIDDAYAAGQNDEFIKPRLIDFNGIGDNDVVIFFNFRFDRTRQLTRAFIEPDFKEFATRPNHIHFVAMTHYYDNGHFAEMFPEIETKNLLGQVIANAGLRQLRCAETEKYAHVTFFFNGQINDPFTNEDRILVNSPKVATYDLKPEMSAYEVRDKLVEAIKSGTYDVVIANFANGDMVGHTGVYDAIIKAVETVDACVRDVVEAALAKGGVCLLTADHGNAEQTKLDDGSPMTAHTTNPVPFTLVGDGAARLRTRGGLADIAPTMLELLGIPKPADMTGTSLIAR